VTKEPQQLIRDCDTAAEGWQILKNHHEGRTRTHLSSLLLITTLRYDYSEMNLRENGQYEEDLKGCKSDASTIRVGS